MEEFKRQFFNFWYWFNFQKNHVPATESFLQLPFKFDYYDLFALGGGNVWFSLTISFLISIMVYAAIKCTRQKVIVRNSVRIADADLAKLSKRRQNCGPNQYSQAEYNKEHAGSDSSGQNVASSLYKNALPVVENSRNAALWYGSCNSQMYNTYFKPPDRFTPKTTNVKTWLDQLHQFMVANSIQANKFNFLLSFLDTHTNVLVTNNVYANSDVEAFDQACALLLEAYGKSEKSVHNAMLQFANRKQHDNENGTLFYMNLVHMARSAYPDASDDFRLDLVKNQFIFGLRYPAIREKINLDGICDINKIVELVKLYEKNLIEENIVTAASQTNGSNYYNNNRFNQSQPQANSALNNNNSYKNGDNSRNMNNNYNKNYNNNNGSNNNREYCNDCKQYGHRSGHQSCQARRPTSTA